MRSRGAILVPGMPGPIPRHEWSGTKIRFQKNDHEWSDWVDIRGEKGLDGVDANMGAISADATAADNLEAAFDGTGGVTMTLAHLNFNPTGAGDCISLGGSGSGNGIGFTRSGAGEAFDTNFAAALQQEAADALNAYDPPTNAEMVARTLASADYATAANLAVVDGIVDAILVDTAEIGAAGAGLTALASAVDLATVDTVVDGIKAKTDSLTFTVAGQVDANAESMNGATILGDGTAGNLWRGS